MKTTCVTKIINFHYYHVVDAKLVIARNNSILKNFSKSGLYNNLDFVSFTLLLKIKYNRDHIYSNIIKNI
jgi:hypothetical protein